MPVPRALARDTTPWTPSRILELEPGLPGAVQADSEGAAQHLVAVTDMSVEPCLIPPAGRGALMGRAREQLEGLRSLF